MRPHERPRTARAAKFLAPRVSRLAHRAGLASALAGMETFAAVLQGKGAGTGWDRAGEIAAMASFVVAAQPVVVDAGANDGEWSRALATALGRPARFVLVEPQPACVAKLESLDLPDKVVLPVAVDASPGELELFTPAPGAGNASVFDRRDSYFADQEFVATTVAATTIDEIVEQHAPGGVDFCKLDVEGAELRCLAGASRSLEARRVRAWSFEFGSANIEARAFFRDFWDLFTGHDYRIHRVVPGGAVTTIDSYYEDLEYFRGVTNYVAALSS